MCVYEMIKQPNKMNGKRKESICKFLLFNLWFCCGKHRLFLSNLLQQTQITYNGIYFNGKVFSATTTTKRKKFITQICQLHEKSRTKQNMRRRRMKKKKLFCYLTSMWRNCFMAVNDTKIDKSLNEWIFIIHRFHCLNVSR